MELHTGCNWRMDEGPRKDGCQGIRSYILILNHGFTLASFRRGFKNTDACDLTPEDSDFKVLGRAFGVGCFFFFFLTGLRGI